MILQNEKLEMIKEILDDIDKDSTIESIEGLLSNQDRCSIIINTYPRSNVYRQILEHVSVIISDRIESLTVRSAKWKKRNQTTYHTT